MKKNNLSFNPHQLVGAIKRFDDGYALDFMTLSPKHAIPSTSFDKVNAYLSYDVENPI